MPSGPPGYVTADQVISFTGIRPGDLAVETSPELHTLLDGWIGEVKDLIDRDRGRDFLAEADDNLEDVPGTVRSVALRAMGNMVRLARNYREAGTIRLDEWRIGIDETDQVLTRTLRRELRLMGRRNSFGMFTTAPPADA